MNRGKTKLSLVGLLGTTLSMPVLAVDAANVDADDDGLIEISSLAELTQIRFDLSGASFNGNSSGCPAEGCVGYELTADLDFDTNGDGVLDANDDYWNDGAGWLPIADADDAEAAFSGTLEGNGHRISNLMINRPDSDDVGLLARANGARIQHLVLDGDAAAVTGGNQVGVLIGNDNGSDIDNVTVFSDVASDASSSVGGLVGAGVSTQISASRFLGSVIAPAADGVGGMIGSGEGVIDGGYIIGDVTYSYVRATVAGANQVGGIVGNGEKYLVRNSLTNSDVTGTATVGGVYGRNNEGQVSNTAVMGSVSAEAGPAGGIAGWERYSSMQYLMVAASLHADDHSIRPYSGSDNSEFVYEGVWNPQLSNLIQEDATTALTTIQLTCGVDVDNGDGTFTADTSGSCEGEVIAYSNWWLDGIWSLGTDSEYAVPFINGMAARDPDGDGLFNAEDDDDDNDGVADADDAFPTDPTETTDSDADGVGDNSDPFPNDNTEWADTDGDGIGNNADTDDDGDGVADSDDAFPTDASETTDSDGDGVGDNSDLFPNDGNEWSDFDNDGSGDNSDVYPYDSTESADTDGDGVGDNADAFPNDAEETTDSDGDGVGDNGDAFPDDGSEWLDTDNDGIGNNTDTDDDGDGVADTDDAFPLDATGTVAADGVDNDGDGLIDITTLEQLYAIRNSTDGSNLNGVTAGCPDALCTGYELLNDLDFDSNGDGVLDENDLYWNDGAGWEPISGFSAVFEGNGFSINNLMINRGSGWFVDVGLFASANNADIRNLNLGGELASVTGSTAFSNTGALVGSMTYGSMTNVSSTVTVAAPNSGFVGYSATGGLIGEIGYQFDASTELTDLTVNANVSSDDSQVGGIVGSASTGIMSRLVFKGSVSSALGTAGGIAGGMSSNAILSLSYTEADVSSETGSNVGGLVGVMYSSEINNSFSSGTVTAASNAAGIVGTAANSSLVMNVYSLATVTATDSESGVAAPLVAEGADSALVGSSYWSLDNNANLTDELSFGVTNEQLACPTAANDSDCAANVTLYSGWSSDSWDFGTSSELPVVVFDGVAQRDPDSDSVMGALDAFPYNAAASVDADQDGLPDSWNESCDSACQTASGLTLDESLDDFDNDGVIDSEDAFADNAAASVDDDEDGLPDAWNDSCDSECQSASGLSLDQHLNDPENKDKSSGGGSLFWVLGLLAPLAVSRRRKPVAA